MACSFRHNNAKSIWEMTREQTWRKSRHPSSPPTPRLLKPFVSLIAFNLLAPCDKLSIVPFSTINSFRFGRGNSLRPNELLKIKIKINVSRLIIVLFSNVSSCPINVFCKCLQVEKGNYRIESNYNIISLKLEPTFVLRVFRMRIVSLVNFV